MPFSRRRRHSPKPRKESGIDPLEEFKNIVEHLLSFANEK
jgi:hypothetical protein